MPLSILIQHDICYSQGLTLYTYDFRNHLELRKEALDNPNPGTDKQYTVVKYSRKHGQSLHLKLPESMWQWKCQEGRLETHKRQL